MRVLAESVLAALHGEAQDANSQALGLADELEQLVRQLRHALDSDE